MQTGDIVVNGVHVASHRKCTEPGRKKRKRRTSSVPRRSRKVSHPPFDPDADPGEELDPTVVTMATLCSDTGQGRISSRAVQIQTNHAAWKASNREKRARMKMLMESKKYGKKEGAEETKLVARLLRRYRRRILPCKCDCGAVKWSPSSRIAGAIHRASRRRRDWTWL
jgi:hypothetical protein